MVSELEIWHQHSLAGSLIAQRCTNIIASSLKRSSNRLRRALTSKQLIKMKRLFNFRNRNIAVKPNVVEPVLFEIKNLLLQRNPLLISIAAGIQINS